MDNIVLSPIPVDQLVKTITESVLAALRLEKDSDLQDRMITTKEVKEIFGVSAVTVSAWINKGKLKPLSMGGRNRFRYADVMESAKTLKKYKQN